jgi:transcriptional repressor NrdR
MVRYNIGDSRVIESREVSDGVTIRRRRESPDGKRFTTYERIERPNLAVIKKNGSRELFDRDKLTTAIKRSVGKFFTSELEIEEMISNIEESLYEISETEITSRQIGDKVLDELAKRNEVAYVRFASVYHEFKTLDDFVKILEQSRQQKNQDVMDK